MANTVILKERIECSKFGVVFPSEVELKFFKDVEGRIFVEHPIHKNIYTRAKKSNIKN